MTSQYDGRAAWSRAAMALAVLFTCLTATGCGSSEEGASNAASGAAGESITVGGLVNQGDSFFQQVQQGMEEEAKARGVTLTMASSGTDPAKEAQNVANLITRDVDVIAISPISPAGASVSAVEAADQAGIPVVCYNGCIEEPGGLVEAVITSNQAELGRTTALYAADYIEENLNGAAVIGEMNCDQFEACKLRRTTFEEVLAERGVKAKYVANQAGEFADKSVEVASNILTAHPDINVIFAAYGDPTYGAVQAIKSAGKSSDVVVFGIDMSPDLAKAMQAEPPIVQATTGQGAVQIGKQAIANAIAAATGEPIAEFEQTVPPILYSVDDDAKIQAYLQSLN